MLLLIRRLVSFDPFALLENIEQRLVQFRWYRVLVGGTFVKIYGKPWKECIMLWADKDGSRYIQVNCESMHETNLAIERIESFR
jgi:hypothetical protein